MEHLNNVDIKRLKSVNVGTIITCVVNDKPVQGYVNSIDHETGNVTLTRVVNIKEMFNIKTRS